MNKERKNSCLPETKLTIFLFFLFSHQLSTPLIRYRANDSDFTLLSVKPARVYHCMIELQERNKKNAKQKQDLNQLATVMNCFRLPVLTPVFLLFSIRACVKMRNQIEIQTAELSVDKKTGKVTDTFIGYNGFSFPFILCNRE